MSGIGNKRMAGEPGTSAPPEKKAGVEDSGTTVETIKLGGVSSTEELDIRTLQTKNRKLAEMLDQRQAIEDELREHIEKLECRQATDDASLLIINRYWNQFDENIRIILKRFDLDQGLGDLLSERKALVVPEPEPDSDSNQERKDERERVEGLEPAFSFLATLASSTSEEIESQLQERVESSRRAVAQIVTTYDKLQEKVDGLSQKLNSGDISLMEEAVVELNSYLSHENGRLQELADVLQEKHRVMSQEFSKLQERVETAESRVSVLETMIDDLQWDIDKIRKREQRLNRHLADVLERVNSKGYKVYGAGSSLYGGTITINARKFEEMNAELEENKELAGNRLNELEELRQDLEEVTTQSEKLKVELRRAVEEAVKEPKMAQAVSVGELGLPQLELLKGQLEQEVEFLSSSLAQLKVVQTKFVEAKECLNVLHKGNEGKDLLVPLTSSMYVPGKLQDVRTVLVDVGTGYYVEKSADDARAFFKRKIEFLTRQMEKIQPALQEKHAMKQAVLEMMTQKLQQLTAPQGVPGAAKA